MNTRVEVVASVLEQLLHASYDANQIFMKGRELIDCLKPVSSTVIPGRQLTRQHGRKSVSAPPPKYSIRTWLLAVCGLEMSSVCPQKMKSVIRTEA